MRRKRWNRTKVHPPPPLPDQALVSADLAALQQPTTAPSDVSVFGRRRIRPHVALLECRDGLIEPRDRQRKHAFAHEFAHDSNRRRVFPALDRTPSRDSPHNRSCLTRFVRNGVNILITGRIWWFPLGSDANFPLRKQTLTCSRIPYCCIIGVCSGPRRSFISQAYSRRLRSR
jgi:hypothetical protein